MTSDDPWVQIDPPSADDTISGRRVDAKLPWRFFWARDLDRHCLLVFQHQAESRPQIRMPQFRGLEVTVVEPPKPGQPSMLILRLLDPSHRDIFHRLCLDIVAAAAKTATEAEAAAVFLARTWRWHHLLRGGRDKRLSGDEQKGLLGELIVLEHHLLPVLSSRDAVTAWTGPGGAPKDFEIGHMCIEAKARRGAATPFIAISSEHQLDTAGLDVLYLHVVEVDSAPQDSVDAFTLADIAARVRERIAASDPVSAIQFEALLTSRGFSWEDDYEDTRWIWGASQIYEVGDGFPRITPACFPSGVTNVRYALSLQECIAFRVPENSIRLKLKETFNGDFTG